MALQGLELHHVALRIRPGTEDATESFFSEVLGIHPDPGAREIPGIPLFWMDVDTAQVHLFSVEGTSEYARTSDRDPFVQHVAFGVPDIAEARAELERLSQTYWRVGRNEDLQLFTYDPTGNMIELHQVGTCRCQSTSRLDRG
ncbi:VOC family protein [Nocardioides massiliensis]|uniref:Catechol 2,3-dioxygenase-like lactoylglutathione lyase family enzyme n=1 Tax=Nocardioides massiliensis TaxID=1325935 RepID=A0ABT9NK28_9ACTN|nr:VOC family protein [Nocardioides massiliensis]MDP9820768.1 catechol 2,3-dioxygenase-like lactoylglutathione lyase family enzyme [Nocardioides massiliensis]